MITIGENVVIEWVLEEGQGTRVERILWVDTRLEKFVSIDLKKEGAMPVWKDLLELDDDLQAGVAFRRPDPFAHYANPDPEFLERHRPRRDHAWGQIAGIVKDEPDVYLRAPRGRLVKKVVAQQGADKSEIYRLLRRYWVRGKVKNALLPSFDQCGSIGISRVAKNQEGPKRGRPSKIAIIEPDHAGLNVDGEMVTVFACAVKLYYDTNEKNPLKRAFKTMLDNHYNVGYAFKFGVKTPILAPPWEQPTYHQFRHWYQKQQNLQHSLVKREGQRKYDLQDRPLLGNSTRMAFGPGSIYQIDATIGDVYLVSSLNRSWIIGRPVIYFVIDTFSRMAVGLYVGLEGPSWAGAMMAIANATTDKVEFCAESGVTITPDMWPVHYLPVQILGDNAEMLGYNSDSLADSLDITPANCPPYRADLKGIVEQSFNRANCSTIKWLPGAVQPREPGGKDHRLDATLDLHQFTKIMILTTLQYNLYHWMDYYDKDRDQIRDEVPPIPIDLWEWGIAHRMGQLRERSPEVIKQSLLPKGEARVTERGIKFRGAYFDTKRAWDEQWYVRARAESSSWKVPVCYDPRKPQIIYLLVRGSASIEPCTLLSREERFSNARLEEILHYHAIESIEQSRHLRTERQSDTDLRAQVDQVVLDAQEATDAAIPKGMSKKQRLEAIRTNRVAEKERNREKEAFALGTVGGEPMPTHSGSLVAGDVDESRATTLLEKRRGLLDLIKKG